MWLARRRLKYDAHCCTNDLQFAALLPVHSPPPEGIVQSFCPGALGTRYFKLRIQHRPLPRPISHTHKLVTHTIHPFSLTPVKPPRAVLLLVGSGLKTIAITAIPERFPTDGTTVNVDPQSGRTSRRLELARATRGRRFRV